MTTSLDPRALLPDVAGDAVSLPRDRRGPAPQSAAVMLLASYALAPRAWIGSATLVALLTDLGTTTAGARAVVSRLSRRGVLEGRKDGRATSYRLADAAAVSLARGGRAIASFAAQAQTWDGRWTLVAFSVPQDADAARATLRARLRWRGFVPLYDGLWVSPDPPGAALYAALADAVADAPGTTCSAFRAEEVPVPAGRQRTARDLWDLESVRADYEEFLRRWRPVADAVAAGQAPHGAQALRARIGVEEDYRRFVVLDPRLPLAELPEGWPRTEALGVFTAVFDGLLEPGLAHLRETAARCGQDASALRGHTLAQLAAGLDPHG
ncbi:MAG: PaaX family transcriptional regulator C-terminal domain-containing protein [Kineosporiaceae bacterium]